MTFFPIFLSVVFVVRNEADGLQALLQHAGDAVGERVNDYELIVVDNASNDESLAILKRLTGENGLPNLQIYALTKQVDADTASWVGLENALGDFVAILDPSADDIDYLPEMLGRAVDGADVVFVRNRQKSSQKWAYAIASRVFHGLYKWFNAINLANEAPQYRLLSKRVVNFILQHPQPAMTYRYLPATGGFARTNLEYSAAPRHSRPKSLRHGINQGMRLLVSTTRAPLRLVTSLSLFGAVTNFFYSIYVVAIGFTGHDLAPGWISLSIQQSGMFFLISLVLLVLSEYILHMATLSSEGPLYYVGQEFNSTRMTRREKLNVEEVVPAGADKGPSRIRRAG